MVDKEGYAIVRGFKWGEWVLYGGVVIFSNHRNQRTYSQDVLVAELSKTTVQQLLECAPHWTNSVTTLCTSRRGNPLS